MKRFIVVVLALCALTASCKNFKEARKIAAENKATKADREVVAVAKKVITDDVLEALDQIAAEYAGKGGYLNFKDLLSEELSDKETMVKPDYLLDPSVANLMVSKSQKVNALATLVMERMVRIAYDMPVSESDESIAKLMLDLDFPIEFSVLKNLEPSEAIRTEYEICKEREDLGFFWQFQLAVRNSFNYLVSQNPDLYLKMMDEEKAGAYWQKDKDIMRSVTLLADHDDDLAEVLELMTGDASGTVIYPATPEGIRSYFTDNKAVFAARREALLK